MSWLLHLVASVGAASPNPTVLYVIAAAFTGGLIPTTVAAYRRWKRGPLEDEEMVSRIVGNEMTGMKDLLAEYRVEVEVNKRQLEDYRKQLGDLTQELARAQVRIAHLEDELRETRTNRERILRELGELTQQRDNIAAERDRLAAEAEHLRERVSALERLAARVHPGPQAPD